MGRVGDCDAVDLADDEGGQGQVAVVGAPEPVISTTASKTGFTAAVEPSFSRNEVGAIVPISSAEVMA